MRVLHIETWPKPLWRATDLTHLPYSQSGRAMLGKIGMCFVTLKCSKVSNPTQSGRESCLVMYDRALTQVHRPDRKDGERRPAEYNTCVRVPFAVSAMQYAKSRQDIAETNLIGEITSPGQRYGIPHADHVLVATTSGRLIRLPLHMLSTRPWLDSHGRLSFLELRQLMPLLTVNEQLIISEARNVSVSWEISQ